MPREFDGEALAPGGWSFLACAPLDVLRTTFGDDTTRWTWGRAHTLTHGHALGRQKPLDRLFDTGPLPAPGNRETPNNLSVALGPAPWAVTNGPSTRRLIDEAFRQSGVAPRIAIETDLREVITAIVEAGGGYSILPRTVAERMAARGSGDVRVAEIIPTISRRIGVVHRQGTLSPAGRAFLDLVLRSLPPD